MLHKFPRLSYNHRERERALPMTDTAFCLDGRWETLFEWILKLLRKVIWTMRWCSLCLLNNALSITQIIFQLSSGKMQKKVWERISTLFTGLFGTVVKWVMNALKPAELWITSSSQNSYHANFKRHVSLAPAMGWVFYVSTAMCLKL